MAKRRGKSNKNYYGTAILLFILILLLLFVVPNFISKGKNSEVVETTKPTTEIVEDKEVTSSQKDSIPQKTAEKKGNKEKVEPKKAVANTNFTRTPLELPSVADSTLLYYNKDGRYHILYSEEYKVPLFVGYILTRAEAKESKVKRSTSFKQDPYYHNLGAESADNSDYTRSGYDRGHMLPSADRNDFSSENKATFLFSNITPQHPSLNRQTLSQLESKVRQWAVEYDSLYIVTGSIIRENDNRPIKRIGKGVAVPQYIYKVVAAKSGDDYKTIGFVMPNIESIDSDYWKYLRSVDEVEAMSGVDFFHALPDDIEVRTESEVDLKFYN